MSTRSARQRLTPQRDPALHQGEGGWLLAAYIPLFADGGIFIPSSRDYRLGDDVYVLLSLPDDPQRYPVAGKVAWVSARQSARRSRPAWASASPADEKSRQLKLRIEEILGHPARL